VTVSPAYIHRPGYGRWLLSCSLGIVLSVMASLPLALFYWVMLDAYIANSEGEALAFGTAFICVPPCVCAVFVGWRICAAVVHSRMTEWANMNLVLTVVGVVGLVLSLIAVNRGLGVIGVVLSLLLVPVIFMGVGDRDPGRVTVRVVGAVLALAAVAGPLVALASETRPF
jgi:hypothetical protein